jgi:hypothetical protein
VNRRETLRWIAITAIGTIIATYAVRGIDWLVTRDLAAEFAALVGPLWQLLHQRIGPLSPLAIGIATIVVLAPSRLGWVARRLSRLIILVAVWLLPRRVRERWREELLGELTMLEDRPLAGLLFAARIAVISPRIAGLF